MWLCLSCTLRSSATDILGIQQLTVESRENVAHQLAGQITTSTLVGRYLRPLSPALPPTALPLSPALPLSAVLAYRSLARKRLCEPPAEPRGLRTLLSPNRTVITQSTCHQPVTTQSICHRTVTECQSACHRPVTAQSSPPPLLTSPRLYMLRAEKELSMFRTLDTCNSYQRTCKSSPPLYRFASFHVRGNRRMVREKITEIHHEFSIVIFHSKTSRSNRTHTSKVVFMIHSFIARTYVRLSGWITSVSYPTDRGHCSRRTGTRCNTCTQCY